MLNKIGLRFQKEIHKGFANPIKCGQRDSGNHDRIKKDGMFFKAKFHAGVFSSRVQGSVFRGQRSEVRRQMIKTGG
jgi:hypothetical protein